MSENNKKNVLHNKEIGMYDFDFVVRTIRKSNAVKNIRNDCILC